MVLNRGAAVYYDAVRMIVSEMPLVITDIADQGCGQAKKAENHKTKLRIFGKGILTEIKHLETFVK